MSPVHSDPLFRDRILSGTLACSLSTVFLTERAGSGSGTVDTSTGSSGCGDPHCIFVMRHFIIYWGQNQLGCVIIRPCSRGFLHARDTVKRACPAEKYVCSRTAVCSQKTGLFTYSHSSTASGGNMKAGGSLSFFTARIQILSRQALQPLFLWSCRQAECGRHCRRKLLQQAPECRQRTRHQSSHS